MNVGLLPVDSNYPNLALMKLSSYHKSIGDNVEWYMCLVITIKYICLRSLAIHLIIAIISIVMLKKAEQAMMYEKYYQT